MYTCIPSSPAFHVPQKNDSRVSCLQQPVMLYLALERVVVLLYATIVQECAKPGGGAGRGRGGEDEGDLEHGARPGRKKEERRSKFRAVFSQPHTSAAVECLGTGIRSKDSYLLGFRIHKISPAVKSAYPRSSCLVLSRHHQGRTMVVFRG